MTNRILVVDDRADDLKSMQEILDYEGYDVRTASNGKEALGYVNK